MLFQCYFRKRPKKQNMFSQLKTALQAWFSACQISDFGTMIRSSRGGLEKYQTLIAQTESRSSASTWKKTNGRTESASSIQPVTHLCRFIFKPVALSTITSFNFVAAFVLVNVLVRIYSEIPHPWYSPERRQADILDINFSYVHTETAAAAAVVDGSRISYFSAASANAAYLARDPKPRAARVISMFRSRHATGF